MSLTFADLKLVVPLGGAPDIRLTPTGLGTSSMVTWQALPTPTRRSSWASVKALYH